MHNPLLRLITPLLMLGVSLVACSDDTGPSDEEKTGTTQQASSTTNDLIDWLVQDVCDANPSQDPYTCVGAKHNLARRELVKYSRRSPGRYDQVRHSFPSWNDSEIFVQSFDMVNPNAYDNIDGYDIVEISPPYVSAIATRDPVSLGTAWLRYTGATERANDSWILFPTDIPAFGTLGSTVAKLHGRFWEKHRQPPPGNGCCNINCTACADSDSYTIWGRQNFTYETGKTLDSIVTHHYSHGTAAASNHKEVFFYTKMYGGTRWERWEVSTVQNPITPTTFCVGSTKSLVENGMTWIMRDCRDWTEVVPYATGLSTDKYNAPLPRWETQAWEAENLYHGTGYVSGDDHVAIAGYHSQGHMIFGPYTTAIPGGPATAEFIASMPATGSGAAFQAEVTNATQGTYLGTRVVYPNGINVDQTFDVNFTAPGGSNALEFRAWWYGAVSTGIDRVRITDPRMSWTIPMDPVSWTADNPAFGHVSGTTTCGSGYCYSRPWLHNAGHAVYGPYTQQVRAGSRTARFHLGSTTSGPFNSGGTMAIVDVYDATKGQVLATYSVNGNNFTGYSAYIYLNFNAIQSNDVSPYNPIAHEFRVWYTDLQPLDIYSVMVY